ncbi:hypothetical protein HNQ51_003158 [Inhella inkyongensis]|uniref:Uncharacterized protein n=1 Tax=Inhella inkyongensis TaxID=392593 RepID=A0A840SBI7_9BURK|nr:hypothetical protein [Inhella inkyongensis]MBB5205831.1 hypothetical protein [Inhella inkyongensis]
MKIEIFATTPKDIELCKAYWDRGTDAKFTFTVAQLSKLFSRRAPDISKIVSQGSRALSKTLSCVNCACPFEFKNRTEFNCGEPNPPWTCGGCVQAAIDEDRIAIRERLAVYAEAALGNPVSPLDLSARQIVCLAALIRLGAREDLSAIAPYKSLKTVLYSPEDDFGLQILRELYAARLVIVSPNSDISKMSKTEAGDFQFYIDEVELLLPDPDPLEFIDSVEELIASPEFAKRHHHELEGLAKELALQECIAFLNLSLAEHQLNYSIGEKTIMVLRKGLDNFSAAQMWNFIWRAAKDAAAFFVRERVSRDHAAKTVVGSIERQIDRAIANAWSVKPFNRNFSLPQSALSMVLFNSVLKTDDGGVKAVVSNLFRKSEPPFDSSQPISQ